MKNTKQLKIITVKTKQLYKLLKTFQPVNNIILFVNNNIKELLLEIEYIDYVLKGAIIDAYMEYRVHALKEPWEYSFFPRGYNKKLKKFYKNIVIRLHHFSRTYEETEFTFENVEYHWYTIYNKTYDAICIYKEIGETGEQEIDAWPAEFLLLQEYTGLSDQEESLNLKLKSCKRLIVALEWDTERFVNEEYQNGQYGKLLAYNEKTIEEIEKYAKNFQSKTITNSTPAAECWTPKEGYFYYRAIGYNQELLEEYLEKNPKEREEIEDIGKEIELIKKISC
jgi:hypothetical protein